MLPPATPRMGKEKFLTYVVNAGRVTAARARCTLRKRVIDVPLFTSTLRRPHLPYDECNEPLRARDEERNGRDSRLSSSLGNGAIRRTRFRRFAVTLE